MKKKDIQLKLNKKQMKILRIIAIVLFLIIARHFFVNRMMIHYYNSGNKAYRQGDYYTAGLYYQDSLWRKPRKKQDCKVRINYALSIVKQITPESVTYENLEESISRLEEAKDILTENECAGDDAEGHNKTAQKLKDEIDEYIKWLKENTEQPEEEKKEEENPEEQKKEEENKMTEEEDKKLQEIKSNLEKDAMLGQEERYETDEMYKDWDYSYFDGKNW